MIPEDLERDDLIAADIDLLRRAIDASGLSIRQYAAQILARDERTVRRWLGGDPMPAVVRAYLLRPRATKHTPPPKSRTK